MSTDKGQLTHQHMDLGFGPCISVLFRGSLSLFYGASDLQAWWLVPGLAAAR